MFHTHLLFYVVVPFPQLLVVYFNFLNVYFYFCSARATLSRYLMDEAAARKELALVKERLDKIEAMEKEMLC
jgi:hypothetical protein